MISNYDFSLGRIELGSLEFEAIVMAIGPKNITSDSGIILSSTYKLTNAYIFCFSVYP